jgi:SAM-dependent methyltransferase
MPERCKKQDLVSTRTHYLHTHHMPKEIAEQHCPICGSRTNWVFDAAPLDFAVARTYGIYKCSSCGHGTTHVEGAVPDELYCSGNYRPTECFLSKVARPFWHRIEANKLGALERQKIPSSLFEVGCGKGRFLRAAQLRGYRVEGVEPSTRSAAYARALVGDAVYNEALDEYVLHRDKDRQFDAVCIWHVLEHLEDPRGCLQDVRKILRSDGVVMLSVPNFASYQAALGKGLWYHLDPPRHAHHFTPNSLYLLLSQSRYRLLHLSHSSLFQNFMGDFMTTLNKLSPAPNSILNLISGNKMYLRACGKLKAGLGLAISLLVSPFIAVPLLIATLVSQAQGRAGTMVAFAVPVGDPNETVNKRKTRYS